MRPADHRGGQALKACPQRSLGPEGQGRREEGEASYSPKAGTALLSRPVRTMFTVGDTRRSQREAVALGADTCPGPTAALHGRRTTQPNSGPLLSSHRARPSVLPETCTPTWSCCDEQRGDPSRVSGPPSFSQREPVHKPGCNRPLLLLPMPVDSNSHGKGCVSVSPLQLGSSCGGHPGSAWIRALPSRGPDHLEESL